MFLDCAKCEETSPVEEIGNYQQSFDRTGPPCIHILYRCQRCNSPILATKEFDMGHQDWGAPWRVYPISGRTLDFDSVPHAITEIFYEAQRCYLQARAYNACAILCRKALEAVCAELGHAVGPLAGRLASLSGDGLIDQTLAEWARELRLSGNRAAHDLHSVSKQDASDILDFTFNFIEYIFTLKRKFLEFKQRRTPQESS